MSIASAHWSHRNRSLPTGWCIREVQDTNSFHEFSAKGGKKAKVCLNVYWKQNFCLGLVSKIKISFFCGRLMYIHVDNGKYLFDVLCCISGLMCYEQETFQIWKSKWTASSQDDVKGGRLPWNSHFTNLPVKPVCIAVGGFGMVEATHSFTVILWEQEHTFAC